MMARSHTVTGMALWSGLVALNIYPPSPELLAGAMVGSLLPDLDHMNSSLGRKYPVIAWIVSGLFQHRGETHSPFAACVIAVAASAALWWLHPPWSFAYSAAWVMALYIGYLSHVLADYFTNDGVPLLRPFLKRRFKAPWTFATGSRVELLYLSAATVFFAVLLIFNYAWV